MTTVQTARFFQWLNPDKTEYVEWWPEGDVKLGGIDADDLGKVFLAQRGHPGYMWGPPEQIGDLATLETARWFALTRDCTDEKPQS